jgi:hypothetical protein
MVLSVLARSSLFFSQSHSPDTWRGDDLRAAFHPATLLGGINRILTEYVATYVLSVGLFILGAWWLRFLTLARWPGRSYGSICSLEARVFGKFALRSPDRAGVWNSKSTPRRGRDFQDSTAWSVDGDHGRCRCGVSGERRDPSDLWRTRRGSSLDLIEAARVRHIQFVAAQSAGAAPSWRRQMATTGRPGVFVVSHGSSAAGAHRWPWSCLPRPTAAHRAFRVRSPEPVAVLDCVETSIINIYFKELQKIEQP